MPVDRPRNGRVQRWENPDYFLMVRYGRLHELFKSAVGLTALDRLVIYELFDLVDYVTDATTGTLAGLAEKMLVSPNGLAASLARLRALGWVDYHFPRGHDGTLNLLIADRVLLFSPRATASREKARERNVEVAQTQSCGYEPQGCDSEVLVSPIPFALREKFSGCATGATRARGVCSVCDEPSNPASAVNGRDYCIDCEPF